VVPIPEDHPTNSFPSYGVMKLAREKYVFMYRRLHGLNARVLRCAIVYGVHQPVARGMGLVAAVLERVH
jgi:UDP-glucose 4-epimerase